MSALQGTNIVLLGHLSKSAYEWKSIIKKNGGTVSQLASAKVTHLVTTEDESHFQQETIKKAVASRIAIVKEEWLTDSIAQGSPLPFASYSIGDVQPSQSEVEERQTAVQTLSSSARDSLSYSGGNESSFSSSSSSSSSSSQAQQDPSKIPALPEKPLAARTTTINTSTHDNLKDFTKTNYVIKNRVVLQCTDIKNNNNKFYCLELHESPQGNTRLFTHYGRTDIVAKNPNGGITEFRYAEKNVCQAAYLRLYDEKLKKGYEPIELIGSNIGSPKAREIFGAGLHEAPASSSSSSSSSFSSSSLSPELSSFVSNIFDEATTALIANVAAEITPLGIKTPLGVLTVSQIEKGERILDQIETQLSSSSSAHINASRLESLSSSFYSAIPHKIGRSQSEVRAASIDTAAKLAEKRETVTLMKDLVKLNERGALSTGAVDLKYKALGCTLEPISLHSSLGEHIKRWVAAQVRSGQKSAGEIVSIHAVTRSDERTRFSDVGNQKLLFHGSRACNVVGLLSRGILDPASVVHKGGRRTDVGLLGDGIYFTDSIGTASKYAHPGKSNTKFALVHRVSLGNVYQTTAHMIGIREPPTRFDSVHGVRSESSAFDDDEFVIYNIRRQYQELLIEFREGPIRSFESPPVPEPNLSSISSGTLSSQPSVVEEPVAFTPPVWSVRGRPAPKPISVPDSNEYWSTEAVPGPSAPPASSFIPSHNASSSSSSGPIATEEAEEKYRRLFASNRNSYELNNPYVNLINVFENKDKFQLDTNTVLPNLIMKRQVAQTSATGSSVCLSNDHFRSLWRAFTMGALHGLDWTNVFAAGGSVLHCLENFHADATNNSSDVDLFIYGLSESAANKKVREIYNAILVNTPQAAIVRGKHAITIIQEYPTRHIQIVLRLYKSPAEILMGFDIDCCSVGFDGNNVWATPRACRALNQRVNRVDLTRRSLTYEVRLYKYAKRGFAVALPKPVDTSRVSPYLRQKKVGEVRGLARLLIFDAMMTTGSVALDKSTVKTFREDDRRIELQLRSAQEDSDYNNILIPWGPRFTISTILSSLASIQSKISETNSSDTFFISGIEGVINGETSDRSSVRGPIQWVSQNPGAQLLTSSFHPLDAANWEDDAYASYPNNPNVVFVPIASSSTSSPFPKKKTSVAGKAPRKSVFGGKKSKFLPSKMARTSFATSPAPAADPLNSLFAQRAPAAAAAPSLNNNFGGLFSQSPFQTDALREMGLPKNNNNNFGGFPGLPTVNTLAPPSSVPSSLQTNVRTANLSSLTTEQEPISPTKLMDRFSAIAPQSDVSKLLLLIATLCRKGLINESERQQLKDFVIQRKGSLVSALEVFEIEHDFEELADTLKRICRLSR